MVLVSITPVLLWAWRGEGILSGTNRIPAEVLIVEGWIGIEGVKAAKAEFDQGGYRYIVTTGGLTNNRWGDQQWNYAVEAAKLLRRFGVTAECVIEAPALETSAQRTFAAAIAVRQSLTARNIQLSGANVFTRGVHARRSRLVFAKVLGKDTRVGMIAWQPAVYGTEPWWQSSERADDLLKETAGYLYELLLNSGRTSNRGADSKS